MRWAVSQTSSRRINSLAINGVASEAFGPLLFTRSTAVSTDVQSGLATVCYLPGRETSERECWYINMGAVDKSFFPSIAAVNPALTAMANALRVGDHLLQRLGANGG